MYSPPLLGIGVGEWTEDTYGNRRMDLAHRRMREDTSENRRLDPETE
jgi:hypothetical protein